MKKRSRMDARELVGEISGFIRGNSGSVARK